MLAGKSTNEHRRCERGAKSDCGILEYIGRCFLWFCVTLGILVGLLYLTAWIPKEMFREKLLASAVYLEENEDEFYQLSDGNRATEIHNYADAITLNIMYSINGENRWDELMMSPFYSDNANEEYQMISLLRERIEEEKQADTIYDRYWHGMMILLRPLFCIFNIEQLRILMLVILVGLLTLLSVQLWRKGFKTLTVSLWVAAFVSDYYMVAACIEYQPTWLIMLIVSLVAIKFYQKRNFILGLAVTSGVCCAFFDFLTTETIAIVIPLVIVLCLWNREGLLKSLKQGIGLVCSCGAAWGIAYIATLMVKWTLSGMAFGEERFSQAIQMILYRQGAEIVPNSGTGAAYPQAVTALLTNVRLLFGLNDIVSLGGMLGILVFGIVIMACVIYIFRKKGTDCVLSILLFLLGCVPLVRIMVLNNHSLEHCFFVYRALFATLVCGITGFVYVIDWEFVKKSCLPKRK